MEWLIPLLIVVVLIVIVGIYFWATYNSLVTLKVRVDEAWSDITVQLKRRADLIPNLIETVKGYAAHERTVLAGLVEARNAAVTASGSAAAGPAETALTGSLRGVLAVAEAYPDLKAAGPFQQLQAQLAETEDRIAAGRRFYNGNVRALNTRVEAFPSSLVASAFHIGKADYFETDDPAVRAPVQVEFTS